MEDPDRQYAMRLLRAIKEQHPDARAGAWIDPYIVAYEAGLDPDTPFYRRALGYLLDEDALKWAQPTATLQSNPIYEITNRGEEMIREA